MIPAHPRHRSDCVASALASVLELPIEEVPNFWREGRKAGSQYEQVRRWLAGLGFHWEYSQCRPRSMRALRSEKIKAGVAWPPSRGYWIGHISRVDWLVDNEPSHVVVMWDRRCVFNPSGTTKSVLEDDVWLIGYYLLVPLDPAELLA